MYNHKSLDLEDDDIDSGEQMQIGGGYQEIIQIANSQLSEPKIKCLVVNDDGMQLYCLKLSLESLGNISVNTACNGF